MTAKPRLPITCTKYEPFSGTRRCRHYNANGACSLPDELMCVEWLKANPPGERTTPAPSPSGPTPVPLARTLFGEPIPLLGPGPETRTGGGSHAGVRGSAVSEFPKGSFSRVISEGDLASLKSRGVEVRLTGDAVGEIWLVPRYTSTGRREISFDDAALLATLCAAFPGSHVTAFEKKKAAST